MKRKIGMLLIAAALFLSSCSEAVVTEATEESVGENGHHQLYQAYIDKLDEMLDANATKVESCKQYGEFINSIYLYGKEYYHGWLQADYNKEGVWAIQMLVQTGEQGEVSDDKQKWIGRILEDGSLWLSYCSTYDEKVDLPDYVVNESILRYSMVDNRFDDDSEDIAQEKESRMKQITEALEENISGNEKELWSHEGKVYQIDRQQQIFMDVTDSLSGLLATFLAQQPERISCRTKMGGLAYEEVEKWKPEGYIQLSTWNNKIAVSDLNADGGPDYVVALYPDDFEAEQRYEEFSPYEKIPEYYASEFWLLLSKEDGEYEQIRLTGTIEYPLEDALSLVEVTFVKDKLLQLEYFIGRSPFYNAVLQFEYDEEAKDFTMYRSYFRETTFNEFIGTEILRVGEKENYGELSMSWYFTDWEPDYKETRYDRVDDIYLGENIIFEYFSTDLMYGHANLLEEHRINSLIWNKEQELVSQIQEKYRDRELHFWLYGETVLDNASLISGWFTGDGKVILGENEQEVPKFVYPVMIDKTTGEYVHVTEWMEQDTFLQIFRDYMAEERNAKRFEAEEIAYWEYAITNYWENADSVEHFWEKPQEILCLQIVPSGVLMGARKKDESWMSYIVIDRECFIGTKLWKYMKPEWM